MNQDKPNRIDQPEGTQNLYRRPSRPTRQEPKPIQVLDSATNEAGEVFNAGDMIQVTSPWGSKAKAEITDFYQDAEGKAWAHYTPNESREGWQWEGGCILAALLVKAAEAPSESTSVFLPE